MAFKSEDIIIQDVRLSHPRLWVAEEYKQGDGRPRWSANFITPVGSETDKQIEACILRVAQDTWGKKAEKTLASIRGQKSQWCYMPYFDDDEDDDDTEFRVLKSHTSKLKKDGTPKRPPTILDWNKDVLTAEAGRPYAGCFVNATVSIYIQPDGEHMGVRSSFSIVQFARDGAAFGGGGHAPNIDAMPDISAPPGLGEEDEDLV